MGTRCVTSGRARGCSWQHWPLWALPAQPGRKWRDGRWLSFPSSFHQGQIGACVRNPKMALLARTLGPRWALARRGGSSLQAGVPAASAHLPRDRPLKLPTSGAGAWS
jgi:hypothetical protein